MFDWGVVGRFEQCILNLKTKPTLLRAFFCQFKQLFNNLSPHRGEKWNAPISSSVHCMSYSFFRNQKPSYIHSNLSKRPRNAVHYKCVSSSLCDQRKFQASHLSSDKSTGWTSSKIGELSEAVEKDPSWDTNCFPFFFCSPLRGLKPYINFQPPQWNISATAVPFLVWRQMSAAYTSHQRHQAGFMERASV